MDRREILKLSGAILGYTIVGGTAAAVLTGCKSDVNAMPADLDLFDQSTYDLIVDVTERIIPKTDTPGAKDANVVSYVHSRLKNFATEEERTSMMEALKQFDSKAEAKFGKTYNNLPEGDKNEILTMMQAEASKDGDHIFNKLKQETVVGFFTSEVGATEVLNFDPIPGAYNGCIDFAEGDTVWAL